MRHNSLRNSSDSKDWTRRFANDRVAIRAKAAKGPLPLPASDHNEVGIVVQGRAAHNAGCATAVKTHVQSGSGVSLQHTQCVRETMP